MAYLIAPDYKSEAVLCQAPCKHLDCAAMRQDWLKQGKCEICGKQIEPGQTFYYLEHGVYRKEHTACAK